MPRILRRAAAVAAAVLIPAAVFVPAAHADIEVFGDVGAHITAIRVSHGPATVGVGADDADMEFTTRYQFWLDTNSSDPGPEYRVDVNPNSEVSPLLKVANFASPGIKQGSCTGLRVSANPEEQDQYRFVKIVVPRSCMGTPTRVRVSVVGFYEDPDITDWAPGTERFYPWVNR